MNTLLYFAAEKLINSNAIPHTPTSGSQLQNILNFFFGLAAAIAVLMIVVAGFFFVTARGNPEIVAKARMTILYACIGLVVVIFAATITTFIIFKVT